MTEQLSFEFDYAIKSLLADGLGDRRSIRPGPQRLLVALVRQGLAEEDLRAAAGLVVLLDERRGTA